MNILKKSEIVEGLKLAIEATKGKMVAHHKDGDDEWSGAYTVHSDGFSMVADFHNTVDADFYVKHSPDYMVRMYESMNRVIDVVKYCAKYDNTNGKLARKLLKEMK